MRTPNHVDNRRKLRPAAYFPTDTFGHHPSAKPMLPPDGDLASLHIAALTHQLLCRYRAGGYRPSGAALGRTHGFSKTVFSETLAGRRWPGESVLAALLTIKASGRGAATS